MNKMPKYIRMDQSGENKKMKKMIKQMYPRIHFEMTARDTPQLNGKIERAIATFWNRVRATLNSGGFHHQKETKFGPKHSDSVWIGGMCQ